MSYYLPKSIKIIKECQKVKSTIKKLFYNLVKAKLKHTPQNYNYNILMSNPYINLYLIAQKNKNNAFTIKTINKPKLHSFHTNFALFVNKNRS